MMNFRYSEFNNLKHFDGMQTRLMERGFPVAENTEFHKLFPLTSISNALNKYNSKISYSGT